MISKEVLTAVILAGGTSQRMGQDKAFIELDGQTFIERILAVTKGFVKDQIIIANTEKYQSLNVKTYSDLIKNCGPVGGIYTAMQVVETPYLLVLSCDIPLLSSSILEHLINGSIPCAANVLTSNGRYQPLTAIYHKDTMPVFKEALEEQRLKLRSLLPRMDLNTIVCPKNLLLSLENINTPDDLKKVRNGYKN